jgi:hypothetical protein
MKTQLYYYRERFFVMSNKDDRMLSVFAEKIEKHWSFMHCVREEGHSEIVVSDAPSEMFLVVDLFWNFSRFIQFSRKPVCPELMADPHIFVASSGWYKWVQTQSARPAEFFLKNDLENNMVFDLVFDKVWKRQRIFFRASG